MPDSEQVVHCRRGVRFEPSVAKKMLRELLDGEPCLTVVLSHELVSVKLEGSSLRSIAVRPIAGELDVIYEAKVFIDATYEGDLAAMAGVPYSLGRESRDEWNEEHAGVIYQHFRTKQFLPGSTGVADDRIQSYNFRLCLTKNRENQAPFRKPASYDKQDYVSLIGDVAEGRVRGFSEACNTILIPNGKTDTNNHHYCLCSTDLPEENQGYADGGKEERRRFVRRLREYTQGLLWFLQHDEELPDWFREDSLQWGYAADEFEDTDHFPPQMYIREARRIHGEYVFTENDARLAPGMGRAHLHHDSIATGDYGIDSHATQKRKGVNRDLTLEGLMTVGRLQHIYQIPYGVIVPLRIDRLLVPVAVSASHIGFGTIRMEPNWMQIGFAAGVAADLSIATGAELRELPIDDLQDRLIEDKQMITYFKDNKPGMESNAAAQYFGSKGMITDDYTAGLDALLAVKEASRWITAARQLPGGEKLPCLPVSDRYVPAGEDMSPRTISEEALPQDYWEERPLLSRRMAIRWQAAAARSLKVSIAGLVHNGEGLVRRGEFLTDLYEMLRTARRNRRV
ncbi:FAD-dependent oxidoreductase [Paenibacillus hemerocallicola]|uniref:FAD-dependent oxidoreductase n=1 Tax=Paenibacillus hemerocallicola TaxID=1172614 RepID=UPI0024824165|nr:FAD-dependent oxidoreductase [Paenibacillus hemerocallicola]